MCCRCGGYSQFRSPLLKSPCNRPNPQAQFRIQRFLVRHRHPGTGKPLEQSPSFWHDSPENADEVRGAPLVLPTATVEHDFWTEDSWNSVCAAGMSSRHWEPCDFSVPPPDDQAFLDAVKGNLTAALSDAKPQVEAENIVPVIGSIDSSIQRPTEGLAPLMKVASRIRGRFRMHSSDAQGPSRMLNGIRQIEHAAKCTIANCHACDLANDALIWALEVLEASNGLCAGEQLEEDLEVLRRYDVLLTKPPDAVDSMSTAVVETDAAASRVIAEPSGSSASSSSRSTRVQ